MKLKRKWIDWQLASFSLIPYFAVSLLGFVLSDSFNVPAFFITATFMVAVNLLFAYYKYRR